MDLSASMNDDLANLKRLGNEIGKYKRAILNIMCDCNHCSAVVMLILRLHVGVVYSYKDQLYHK